nr:MAG TPA_asm: hypothetical protein [Caudoviricetes sp.]
MQAGNNLLLLSASFILTKNKGIMRKYHYEYNLVCVDLRNGGAKRGPYRSFQNAKFDKHFLGGIWDIRRVRVYE